MTLTMRQWRDSPSLLIGAALLLPVGCGQNREESQKDAQAKQAVIEVFAAYDRFDQTRTGIGEDIARIDAGRAYESALKALRAVDTGKPKDMHRLAAHALEVYRIRYDTLQLLVATPSKGDQNLKHEI